MNIENQIIKIKELIDEVDVVSFDVFDTLITRILNSPENVFDLMEEQIDCFGLARERKQLQMKASQKVERETKRPHANYDEIYEYMKNNSQLDVDWDRVKNLELQIESDCLFQNSIMFQLVEYARAKNKRIIINSDMYLDTDTVKSFLDGCGYAEFDAYYVSSDVSRTKYNGDIYYYISEKEAVSPSKILHVGDNQKDDYEMAIAAGWKAFHYVRPDLPEADYLKNRNYFSVGTGKYVYKEGVWENIGSYAGGNLYLGLIQWMRTKLSQYNYDKVFFLARDGYNLYKLSDLIGIENKEYLRASRRSMLLAGITELDDEALRSMPPYTLGQTLKEIFDYLCIDVSEVEHLNKVGFSSFDDKVSKREDMECVKELFKLNSEVILRRCALERKNMETYLEAIGFLDSESIVFDCGWNGSSQYLLNRVLERINYKGNNKFLYVGIMDTEKSRRQLRGLDYETFLFDSNHNRVIQDKVNDAIVLFELFFGAPEGSVWYYDDKGPVLEQNDSDDLYREKILEGIRNFVETALPFADKYGLQTSLEQTISSVIRLIHYPSHLEAEYIGNIENVDGFAKKEGETTFIAKVSKQALLDNPDVEVYWPQGVLKREDISDEVKEIVAHRFNLPFEKSEEETVREEEKVENKGILELFRNIHAYGLKNALTINEKIRKERIIKDAYSRWIDAHEKCLTRVDSKMLAYRPKFSFVVPVYNVLDEQLIECIESILNQSYENFELILVDDNSSWESVRIILKKYESNEKVRVIYRKENGHISKATNSGIEIADGDYIAFSDCDDTIAPNALYEMAKKLNENPDLDFIYSDEDKLSEDGKHRHSPFFKPDWSPDTFFSLMYTNHLAVYRTSIVKKVGGLRSIYDGTQDYDFTLRFMEESDNSRVGHVPYILYHWRERGESIASNPEAKPYALLAMKKMKEECLNRRGIAGQIEYVNDMYQYHVVYDSPKKLVSIIIPSKDNFDMLVTCIESIKKHTVETPYEIIVVDNGSNNANREKIAEYLSGDNVVYIYEPMDFNFSKMCNIGAEKSNGEYLLFLNDDVEVVQDGWIDRMAGHASQKHIGAIGAKLFYPDSDVIQHIGITNLPIGPSHQFMGFSDRGIYYFGRNRMEYDWLAVTAACLMVSRENYDRVSGFDEELKVGYNDVDFCFKLHEAGLYNVVRNDVILYHYESASRGSDDISEEKKQRLLIERERLYKKHPDLKGQDPFYNVNLTPDKGDFRVAEYVDYLKPVTMKESEAVTGTYTDFSVVLDELCFSSNVYMRGWFTTGNIILDNKSEVKIIVVIDGKWYVSKANKEYRRDVGKVHGNKMDLTGFNVTLDAGLFMKKPDRIGISLEGRNYLTWLDYNSEIVSDFLEEARDRKNERIYYAKVFDDSNQIDEMSPCSISLSERKVKVSLKASKDEKAIFRMVFSNEGRFYYSDPLGVEGDSYEGEFYIDFIDRECSYNLIVEKTDMSNGVIERRNLNKNLNI